MLAVKKKAKASSGARLSVDVNLQRARAREAAMQSIETKQIHL